MATIPVYSPTVPFLGLVPGGLRPGSMIRIKGAINNHGERCQINIQTGAALNPRDDVTLHLSIRPAEHAIVRNTLQNQVWGPEERHGGCPIRYGQSFDVLVLVEVNQYKIAINGAHFCMFSHRLPVHSAKYVSISGGCVIHAITSEMDTSAPSSSGPAAPPYPGMVPATGPHPPPYTPYPPATGSIGFVPAPPPMPPPPPYTPTPGYPVHGGSGHYPGGPPYPGSYPHQPGYPAATPYSTPQPSAPSAPGATALGPSGYPALGTITSNPSPQQPPKSMQQTITSGMQKTKDFLQDAVFGKTPATKPAYPVQQPPPVNVVPLYPAPGAYPPYQQQPGAGAYGTIQQHPASSGGPSLASGIGLGSAAAVLYNLPVRDIKKEKSHKH